MAIEPVLQRRGNALYPYSDDDRVMLHEYPENKPLKSTITGSRKTRAYKELCCYKGSCKYIADQGFNENMNTPEKVDIFTKIKLGFVESTLVSPHGNVQFITKSLAYANCDQPESHRYIEGALEEHASLMGIKPDKKGKLSAADVYVEHLRQLGQGYGQ